MIPVSHDVIISYATIDKVFHRAKHYNDATVRTLAGTDEAILKALSRRGASVRRVDFDTEKQRQAYENLSLLVSYRQITLPNDPELLADLETGNNNTATALCLLTYNVHPERGAKKTDMFGGYDEHQVHSWLPPSFARDHKRYFDLDFGFEY